MLASGLGVRRSFRRRSSPGTNTTCARKASQNKGRVLSGATELIVASAAFLTALRWNKSCSWRLTDICMCIYIYIYVCLTILYIILYIQYIYIYNTYILIAGQGQARVFFENQPSQSWGRCDWRVGDMSDPRIDLKCEKQQKITTMDSTSILGLLYTICIHLQKASSFSRSLWGA